MYIIEGTGKKCSDPRSQSSKLRKIRVKKKSNGLFIHGNGEVNISNDYFKEVKLTIVMGKRKNNNTKGFVNFTWESYERHLVNFILVQ